MVQETKDHVQWLVGLVCAALLAYMLYLSGKADYTLDGVAIGGALALIALLLGYERILVKLMQLWRGGHFDPPPDTREPSRGGEGAENSDDNEP